MPIEYFFSVSFKYLLPYAIGFVFPSSCFCQSVFFRVRWCLRLLLLCYFCLPRNGPDMVLRLPLVIFQNLSVVLLPSSMVHFSSEVLSVGLFVPKISVGILPYIVLLREMILVLLCFPVSLVLISLQFFLHSV